MILYLPILYYFNVIKFVNIYLNMFITFYDKTKIYLFIF